MRLLDKAKIAYEAKEYPVDENDLSGSHVADVLGVDHGSMFKTLVLKGDKTGYLVVCRRIRRDASVAKSGSVDGCEFPLPDRTRILQRIVRMPGNAYGLRIGVEETAQHFAALIRIVRIADGVFRMVVRDNEHRL